MDRYVTKVTLSLYKRKKMTFKCLISDPQILRAIEAAGYVAPTPIQEKAIPKILAGFDLRASAQTGTGKSAAFLLPALVKLTTPAPGRGPRVLILVPTRELALQVAQEATVYSQYLSRVKTVCIYGGVPYPAQYRELSRPYEILVATPGRLIDHLGRGTISLARVELLILDEADRMLDMGFIEPVERIAESLPKPRQTLLFSATLRGKVLALSQKLLHQPLEISISPAQAKQDHIEQRLHLVDNLDHKRRLLDHFLSDSTLHQAVVFTSTKAQADELAEALIQSGHTAAALHGDMHQKQRTRTLTRLRQGAVRVLVATDVAARGIDVHTISHVINFDLPLCAEDYVHRIGRTGRAGAHGVALSFAAPRDFPLIKRIEQFTGHRFVPQTIPGLEPRGGKRRPHRKRP
jgi:superfamily II DNA/RNA helicase